MPQNQIIRVKATLIVILVNQPAKRFLELNKTLIVINSDIFEHLAPNTKCPTCGPATLFLDTETEWRLNDDFLTTRIGNMLCFLIISWST